MIDTCITGILHANSNYINEYINVYKEIHKSNKSCVKYFKDILGKQSCCKNYTKRFWVWERNNYNILVANKIGYSIEVSYNTSYEEATEIWKNFLLSIGIKYV
jgi:hypothetical protein